MLVKDLMDIIQGLAPPDLAEEWDNPGLQIGSPQEPVRKVALALDATEKTVEEAISNGCNFLFVHHPLIFKPLKKIDNSTMTGRIISRAAAAGLTIFAAHTNWDSAEKGVAQALADVLQLEERRPLEPAMRDFYKLVVFVPAGYENRLRQALFEAGAGTIGDYDHCWFALRGEGGFRPPEDANPFLGERGRENRVPESRLEVIAPRYLAGRLAEVVRAVHPYEEPAFEFQPVKVQSSGQGLGLIGQWNPPRDLLTALRETCGLGSLKWAGLKPGTVSRVALLPGSGGGYMSAAKSAGAEVLITGDVGYHLALEAESLGLTLVDLGHFETEWPSIRQMAGLLKNALKSEDLECLILNQRPPWHYGAGN